MKHLMSLTPVVLLLVFLTVIIRSYGADALSGPCQIALVAATGLAAIIAIGYFKTSWQTLEAEMNKNIGNVGTPIVILLLIGLLSGAWMVSGVVPMLIYYGVHIIHPHVFLVSSCALCAFVSVMTGSSWSTVATIGLALMGIGKALGFSDGWTAGAIISGAYFGDKMSPLSDTTVLASSICGTPLFTHIRYMMITTIPTFALTLIIFLLAGFFVPVEAAIDTAQFTSALAGKFDISPWLLIVPVMTAWMIYRQTPAVIVLSASSALAIVFALIFQPAILAEVAGCTTATVSALFRGAMQSCFGTTGIHSGMPAIDELLTTRGMAGMLNTVWLILCAMCYGAVLKASGMIANIVGLLRPLTRSRVGLVASTEVTAIFVNGTTADQCLAIMLPASMFGEVYERQGYEPRLLSRTVEDAGTVTSVLFPWSTCGMTQSTVLGVPTLTYLPYCFFNFLSPLMSLLIAAIGYKIVRRSGVGK